MKRFKNWIKEDAAPVNAVGGGAIAGVGVGPDGEPGISRKKKRPQPVLGLVTRRKPFGGQEKAI